jgi:hypothetical protein
LDTWIDEGLASQAEYMYLGDNITDKCEWFSNDERGTIAKGNNFFVWDNHKNAILDEYATVYLFFRWLYLQADTNQKTRIFYDIASSKYIDYRAVTDIAGKINPAWDTWENLLRTWLAANYYPGNAHYGYKEDGYLQKTIKVRPIAEQKISLYPGEGVYSFIKDSFSPVETGNIRYTGLTGSETDTGTSPPYNGNILLTFNANKNNKSTVAPETGSLTGVSPAASVVSRMAAEGELTGPYVLDARDVLGRNREKELYHR